MEKCVSVLNTEKYHLRIREIHLDKLSDFYGSDFGLDSLYLDFNSI